jgi:hypothetical protein
MQARRDGGHDDERDGIEAVELAEIVGLMRHRITPVTSGPSTGSATRQPATRVSTDRHSGLGPMAGRRPAGMLQP